MIKKEAEKILKYKDPTIEVQYVWNVKINTISKSFRKYLNTIPGKHEISELWKAAILSTAHILRIVLIHKKEHSTLELHYIYDKL